MKLLSFFFSSYIILLVLTKLTLVNAIGLNIETKEDLIRFAERVNNGNTFQGSTVLMMNDLYMNNTSCIIGGNNSFGIFKGTFDGQGYTINDLMITSSLESVGLFSTTRDATIRNVFLLKTCSIKSTLSNATNTVKVGGIVGYFMAGEKGGTIENVVSCTNIFFSAEKYKNVYVGGISGYSIGMSEIVTIKNCASMSTINIPDNMVNVFVGGISGMIGSDILWSEIINCNNIGRIIVGNNVNATIGGIVGYLLKSSVYNCINDKPVDGDADMSNLMIGDIVGEASNSIISYCYNKKSNGYNIVYKNDSSTIVSETGSYDKDYNVNTSLSLCNETECRLIDMLSAYINKNKINNYVKWIFNENNNNVYFTLYKTGENSLIKSSSSLILVASMASRDSYFFNGWYEDEAMTQPFNGDTINKDTHLYGKWDKNDKLCTITYKDKDNHFKTFSFGSIVSLDRGHKHSNGSFVGMWMDENGVIVPWEFRAPSYDITLYPRYVSPEINTVEDLLEFSRLVNSGANCKGIDISLNNDIDFNNTEFVPIGEIGNSFEGTFEGNGHVISNLNVSSNSQVLGFIGFSKGLTIRNLIFDSSCEIKNNYKSKIDEIQGISIGTFVGYCYSTEQRCIADSLVSMATLEFSGLSNIDESLRFGGIVGNFYAHTYMAAVINSIFYGQQIVSGRGICLYIGGIVGKCFGLLHSLSTCEITNCMSKGYINSTGVGQEFLNIGGIVGFLHSNSIVTNCIWMGEIDCNPGKEYIGAIVGFAINSKVELCYSDCRDGMRPLYGATKKVSFVNNSKYDENYNLETIIHINDYIGFSLVTALISYVLPYDNYTTWSFNYNNYTVTYVLVDENNNNKALFKMSSPMVLLMNFADTSKDKRFSGWYNDTSFVHPFNSKTIDKDIVLYGKWEDIKKCYVVELKKTLYESYVNITVCGDNGLNVKSLKLKRNGYEFVSWMDSDGYPVHTPFIYPKRDTTLTAMWLKTKISSAKDLVELSEAVNSGVNCSGKTIYLENDIDFEGLGPFVPIGNSFNGFSGVFEGRGHRINNLNVSSDRSIQYSGLFGTSFLGAEIKNVVLDSASSIFSSHNISYTCVGGIIGYCSTGSSACKIVNAINLARVESNSEIGSSILQMGGIIGSCDETNLECNINNCANYGDVIGIGIKNTAYIGGIIGKCTGKLLTHFCAVSNSLNNGNILFYDKTSKTSSLSVGGIIGKSDNYNEINGCVNMGDINTSMTSKSVGGISGDTDGTSDVSDNFWYEDTFYGDFTGLNPEIQKGLVLSDDTSFLDKLKEAARRKSLTVEGKNGMIEYKTAWLLNDHEYNVTFCINKKEFVTYNSKVILIPRLIGNEKYHFKGWYKNKIATRKMKMDQVTKNVVIYGKWKKSIDRDLLRYVNIGVVGAIVLAASIVIGNRYSKGYREIKEKNDEIKELLYPDKYDEQQPDNSINTMEDLYKDFRKLPMRDALRDALRDAKIDNEKIDEIVEKCYEKAAELEDEGKLGPGITTNDAAAIAMYTYESENRELSPYRLINKALLTKDQDDLRKVKGILYLLMSALRKLPIEQGKTLYRGIRSNDMENLQDENSYMGSRIADVSSDVHDNVNKDEMQDNKTIVWESLSSTSTDMEVTKSFLANGENSGEAAGTLFIIENGWGYNIGTYSLYQGEVEILLEPERQFRVMSTIGAKLTIVKLEMLKSPLVLSDVFGEYNLKIPIFYFMTPENIKKFKDKMDPRKRWLKRKRDGNMKEMSMSLLGRNEYEA